MERPPLPAQSASVPPALLRVPWYSRALLHSMAAPHGLNLPAATARTIPMTSKTTSPTMPAHSLLRMRQLIHFPVQARRSVEQQIHRSPGLKLPELIPTTVPSPWEHFFPERVA